MLGLVMMHMATLGFWAETFDRKRPNNLAVQRHITSLLLDGLCHSPATKLAKASTMGRNDNARGSLYDELSTIVLISYV